MARISSFFLLVLAGIVFSCVPPDCDHEDCGSCGNACCILEFEFSMSSDAVYGAMVASLKKGGDDGRYRLVNTSDYRPYKMDVKYMMQSIHMTKVHHYNDTQNFYIASNQTDMCLVKAFSISNIEGAYCDAGQNYKNIIGFVKGLEVDFKERSILGCPKNKK